MRCPSWHPAAALLLLLAPAAAQLPAAVESATAEAERPRSVLFYLMDTCRNDRLSYQGYGRPTTPFLEALAERAVVFEACYAQASWTKPSMASMLSSQYPSTTGIHKLDQRLDDRYQTWPEQLRDHGWYTAGFSANIVMGDLLSNYAQGFDHFVESTLINRGDPIRFASGSARKLNEELFPWLDRSEEWPLLLYLHSVDPHEEYEPEPAYLEEFADPARHAQFREEWKALLASRPPIPGLFVTQDNFDRTEIDAASFIEHASDCYDADILANDDQLQLLWERLQEDGWGEDLVFVFTSDHGEEFFDHGGTCHGYSLYDEMVRVPLMIYAPGLVQGGQRIRTPVRSLDIYPTLCELLGVEVPDGLQGTSLVPLMRGADPLLPTEVYSQHREDPVVRLLGQGSGVMTSLRVGRWKYILNQVSSQMLEKPRHELYDLEADPREQRNLAATHPELVREFEAKVLAFQAAHPSPDQRPAAAAEEEMDPAVLEELRELGYIGDEEDEEEDPPDLFAAVRSGDAAQLRRCLETGASLEQLDQPLGLTPLFLAAAAGELELTALLLEAGADVDAANLDGTTPLIGAAFLGQAGTFQLLLDRGADPTVVNRNGDDARAATTHPWEITAMILQLLGLERDQEEVDRGRAKVLKLLDRSA